MRMNTEICETENVETGWARPHGALRHAPISRTFLYDLLRRGVVESHRIGKSATGRGIRLISLKSLDDYVRDPQAAEAKAAARSNGDNTPIMAKAASTGGGTL